MENLYRRIDKCTYSLILKMENIEVNNFAKACNILLKKIPDFWMTDVLDYGITDYVSIDFSHIWIIFYPMDILSYM